MTAKQAIALGSLLMQQAKVRNRKTKKQQATDKVRQAIALLARQPEERRMLQAVLRTLEGR